MRATRQHVNLIPSLIPSNSTTTFDFTPVKSPEPEKRLDTFKISRDGHYIGHDGFIVPWNFAEFYERYPDCVGGQVRGHWSICNKTEREDRESELLIYLMTIPEKSKFRQPGYNGLPDGCRDRIQIFNPGRTGGANAARFFSFINNMLRNHLSSLVQKESSNPLSRRTTINYGKRMGGEFDSYWRSEESEVVHFIGKDIVYFHALFWPAMLMGSGYRTPTRLMVHGFLTVSGSKMSKSRGTYISAESYAKHLDPQYLRYYYAAKLGPGASDIDLNFDDFVNRVDADLVNKIANIPSRVLAMLHKHCGGKLSSLDADGRYLLEGLRKEADKIASLYERREFSQVARKTEEMAMEINAYLRERKPWIKVKEDVAAAGVVCTGAINAFRVLATYLSPILPGFGAKVARTLGVGELTWSGLDEILENCPVGIYERLVDRVDRGKVDALLVEGMGDMDAKT
jgi:hypothetical protein